MHFTVIINSLFVQYYNVQRALSEKNVCAFLLLSHLEGMRPK